MLALPRSIVMERELISCLEMAREIHSKLPLQPAESKFRDFDKCASALGSPAPVDHERGAWPCGSTPAAQTRSWTGSDGSAGVWDYFAALEYRFARFSGVHSSTI
jgi:hypothetical protein